VDCYYHHAVPSVALCVDCKQPICATCRAAEGTCPGCRLGARIDAAKGVRELPGQVPPRPQYQPPPQQQPYMQAQAPQYAAVADVRPESRALAALGFPFWPLALLALIDSGKSPFMKRQALQALGFNAGIYGLWFLFWSIGGIPIIGWPAWPLLGLVIPVGIVASVIYGFKVWQGEDVRVPIVTDYVDRIIPA
jgi:uncharacterized membrane protein